MVFRPLEKKAASSDTLQLAREKLTHKTLFSHLKWVTWSFHSPCYLACGWHEVLNAYIIFKAYFTYGPYLQLCFFKPYWNNSHYQIYLEYTIQQLLIYSKNCITITKINFRTFSSPLKDTLYLLSITPHFLPILSPKQPQMYCLTLEICPFCIFLFNF